MIDDSTRGGEPVERGGGAGGAPEAGPDAARPPPASTYVDPSRRLRESVQRRDELLALAAEDLRGPAASLLRHVRRLRRAAATTPPASDADRRALDALERQVQRVTAVSEALLAMSAIEAGQLQLMLRSVELGALLSQVVETRRYVAQARSIDLTADVPPYPLSLTVDAQRLGETIGELLDSALAATSRGGQVRLALEAQPDGARIVVLDGRATGPHAGRRADRLGGLATRLAVCRGLAELHGGTLETTSRGGAHAVVLTVRSPAHADARDTVRGGAAGHGKARLLLVDDDQDGREALAMVLADDYEVHLAGDGREALETALVARPDVVLMDVYMPRMDGLAALEAMRADPLTEDVPVILISARGDDLTRSRSLDLGAVDFLQKPFSIRELKARIERTLRLTRRETQLQVLARTDPLTGLANLRAFRARLEEEVKRARRYRTPLACVMVDMDHLKPINDELGHGAGDLAIGAVAEVLRHELRETDFGARYGGDEFVMLLPHTSAAEARVFAERACARLRETSIDVEDRRLPLSASFGIAALGDEPLDDPGEALVRHADAALYAAKHAGRGRVAAHPSAEPALPAP